MSSFERKVGKTAGLTTGKSSLFFVLSFFSDLPTEEEEKGGSEEKEVRRDS